MKTIILTGLEAYINQSQHSQKEHDTLVDQHILVVVYNKAQHLELTLPVYLLQSLHILIQLSTLSHPFHLIIPKLLLQHQRCTNSPPSSGMSNSLT